jgi:hypothetical protein
MTLDSLAFVLDGDMPIPSATRRMRNEKFGTRQRAVVKR